jgi:hypothetical protein
VSRVASHPRCCEDRRVAEARCSLDGRYGETERHGRARESPPGGAPWRALSSHDDRDHRAGSPHQTGGKHRRPGNARSYCSCTERYPRRHPKPIRPQPLAMSTSRIRRSPTLLRTHATSAENPPYQVSVPNATPARGAAARVGDVVAALGTAAGNETVHNAIVNAFRAVAATAVRTHAGAQRHPRRSRARRGRASRPRLCVLRPGQGSRRSRARTTAATARHPASYRNLQDRLSRRRDRSSPPQPPSRARRQTPARREAPSGGSTTSPAPPAPPRTERGHTRSTPTPSLTQHTSGHRLAAWSSSRIAPSASTVLGLDQVDVTGCVRVPWP